MISKVKLKWEQDPYGSAGYNAMGQLETTLINLGVVDDYFDIKDTETFDKKYSSTPNRNGHYNEQFKRLNCSLEH